MNKLLLVAIVIVMIVFSAIGTLAQEIENPLAVLTADNAPFVPGDKLLFFGDVITEKGEEGNGYLTLLRRQFNTKPAVAVTIINAGVSANRVPDLQRRFERDVLNAKPTVVFIQIGINDAWRTDWGGGTKEDRYEAGLREMIDKMLAKGIYVILATPTLNGELTDGTNAQDATIEAYAEINRKIAREMKIGLCDLRLYMLDYLKANNPDNKDAEILTTNGIHLNDKGNEIFAWAAAKAIVAAIRQRGAQAVMTDNEFYAPGKVIIQSRPGINNDGVDIRYTIDGTEPTLLSPVYTEPFDINRSLTITARAFWQGKPVGLPVRAIYTQLFPRQAEDPNDPLPGLSYRYYTGTWPLLPDLAALPAQAAGISKLINVTDSKQAENFAFLFSGFIDVPKAGIYKITLISDDGSKMWLGDKMIIISDGHHGPAPVSAEVRLSSGKHAITIAYMQGSGGASLEARWSGPDLPDQPIPAEALWHIVE